MKHAVQWHCARNYILFKMLNFIVSENNDIALLNTMLMFDRGHWFHSLVIHVKSYTRFHSIMATVYDTLARLSSVVALASGHDRVLFY